MAHYYYVQNKSYTANILIGAFVSYDFVKESYYCIIVMSACVSARARMCVWANTAEAEDGLQNRS